MEFKYNGLMRYVITKNKRSAQTFIDKKDHVLFGEFYNFIMNTNLPLKKILNIKEVIYREGINKHFREGQFDSPYAGMEMRAELYRLEAAGVGSLFMHFRRHKKENSSPYAFLHLLKSPLISNRLRVLFLINASKEKIKHSCLPTQMEQKIIVYVFPALKFIPATHHRPIFTELLKDLSAQEVAPFLGPLPFSYIKDLYEKCESYEDFLHIRRFTKDKCKVKSKRNYEKIFQHELEFMNKWVYNEKYSRYDRTEMILNLGNVKLAI